MESYFDFLSLKEELFGSLGKGGRREEGVEGWVRWRKILVNIFVVISFADIEDIIASKEMEINSSKVQDYRKRTEKVGAKTHLIKTSPKGSVNAPSTHSSVFVN
jgi:hypothetical protein